MKPSYFILLLETTKAALYVETGAPYWETTSEIEGGGLNKCVNDENCDYMNIDDVICADMYFEVDPDYDDLENEIKTQGVANVCTTKFYCDKAFIDSSDESRVMYTQYACNNVEESGDYTRL